MVVSHWSSHTVGYIRIYQDGLANQERDAMPVWFVNIWWRKQKGDAALLEERGVPFLAVLTAGRNFATDCNTVANSSRTDTSERTDSVVGSTRSASADSCC